MNNKHPTKPFCGECDHYHNPDELHGTCEICPGSSGFKNQKESWEERFDKEFSYDCDGSGCMHSIIPHENPDGTPNWELHDKLKSFIQQEIDRAVEEREGEIMKIIKKHNDIIQERINYCIEQNGMDACKNCGLNAEDDIIKLSTPKEK